MKTMLLGISLILFGGLAREHISFDWSILIMFIGLVVVLGAILQKKEHNL